MFFYGDITIRTVREKVKEINNKRIVKEKNRLRALLSDENTVGRFAMSERVSLPSNQFVFI